MDWVMIGGAASAVIFLALFLKFSRDGILEDVRKIVREELEKMEGKHEKVDPD